MLKSKIMEKVPMDIDGEKSRKDTARSAKLVSIIRAYAKRKRKRSDSVLWQKPLHQQQCQKGKVTTQTTPQKSSIKQRLRTDLGRSVRVTTATQLVWFTRFTGPNLPTHRNSRVIEDKNMQMVQKRDGTRWKVKRSLMACHTSCKCSIATTRNSAKGKLSIKVMTFSKGLIGCEVPVAGRGSEYHLIFIRGETSYCLIGSPHRPSNFQNDDFKRSTRYTFLSSLLESRLALRIKHSNEEQARTYRKS